MTETRAAATRRERWIHESLFSLNLAWTLVWYERVRNPVSLLWLHSSPLVQYLYWHTRHVEPETVLVQVLWSFALGAVVFLLLRLLARVSLTEVFLRTVTGLFALTGFPLFALTLPMFFFVPARIGSLVPWLSLEVVAASICGVLYYSQKWSPSAPLGVILLAMHFGLWAG